MNINNNYSNITIIYHNNYKIMIMIIIIITKK